MIPFFLLLFLSAIFSFYFFPFQDKVWFYHDDFDILLGSINFSLKNFMTPHTEHFAPFSRLLLFWEFQLFSLNFKPYFMVSLILHSIVLYCLWLIVREITRKVFFAYLAVVLFSINSTFFEVLLYSTEQSLILTTILIALSFLFWLKNRQQKKIIYIILAGINSLLAAFCFTIALPYPFIMFFISFFDKKSDKRIKIMFLVVCLLILPIFIIFAGKSLASVIQEPLSLQYLSKICLFAFTGLMEGLLSRFFYAPFTPSRSANTDLTLLPILNSLIFLVLFYLIKKTFKKNREALFIKLSLIINIVYPYLMIAFKRYPTVFKGAMAERYVYLPLFFFIIFFVYLLQQLKITFRYKRILFVFAFYILTTHAFFFYQKALVWTIRPQKTREFMLNLKAQIKNNRLDKECLLPLYVKSKTEPCSYYVKLLENR